MRARVWPRQSKPKMKHEIAQRHLPLVKMQELAVWHPKPVDRMETASIWIRWARAHGRERAASLRVALAVGHRRNHRRRQVSVLDPFNSIRCPPLLCLCECVCVVASDNCSAAARRLNLNCTRPNSIELIRAERKKMVAVLTLLSDHFVTIWIIVSARFDRFHRKNHLKRIAFSGVGVCVCVSGRVCSHR